MSNPIYFTFDSVWAAPTKKTFLAHESEGIMKDIWRHNRKDTNEVNRPICP
jgi:hypothetical protein